MVFGESLCKDILQDIFNINVKTSSVDAEVITEVILSEKADNIVDQKKHLAQTANELYSKYFPGMMPVGHPLSFYRCLPILTQFDALRLETDLKKFGVRIFHSDRFISGSTTLNKYLRIALSSTNSLDELEMGLKILKQYLY
ncbi:hypothetical protein [Bacillus cereus]|uniref:hypothetical protein n=2 Tax=Bacillus cereus group TaxID=86661 RepID=UPI00384FABEE